MSMRQEWNEIIEVVNEVKALIGEPKTYPDLFISEQEQKHEEYI